MVVAYRILLSSVEKVRRSQNEKRAGRSLILTSQKGRSQRVCGEGVGPNANSKLLALSSIIRPFLRGLSVDFVNGG